MSLALLPGFTGTIWVHSGPCLNCHVVLIGFLPPLVQFPSDSPLYLWRLPRWLTRGRQVRCFIGRIRVRMNVRSCGAYKRHYCRLSQQKNYACTHLCAVRTKAKSCAEWWVTECVLDFGPSFIFPAGRHLRKGPENSLLTYCWKKLWEKTKDETGRWAASQQLCLHQQPGDGR